MKKRSVLILALLLVSTLILSACTTVTTTTATTAAASAETTAAPAASAAGASDYDKLDKVYIGVTAAMSGTNKLVGDYVQNGAKLAAKQINANGGLLGKQVELVFEDEVDNQTASVNAMNKLLSNNKISAFFGSTYSAYCIAVSPTVLEKKIPMMAGGSSANIPKENNPYIWQVRMTDDKAGMLLSKAATETLGMKNPAILHIADSFGTGLKDKTLVALEAIGVKVDPKNIYGHNADEKQFGPIINQIMSSDVDGLIAISHQVPASMIQMQAADAGLEIPTIGSSSFASAVALKTAGEASDNWYAVADWTTQVQTSAGKAFADAYKAEYSSDSDMPAVTAYDSIMVLAEAIKTANSADPAKINEALATIKDYAGGMSTYSYHDNRCFSTSQFLTKNEGGLATMIDTVKVDY